MLPLLLCAILTLAAGEEHEIVYPRMIIGRSGEKRVRFQAFDQDFHLRLEPTDVLADEFVLITRDDKGNEAFLKPDVEHWRKRVLQDRNAGSTIVIDDDEGPVHIKGVVNEELRIEPALDQVGNEDVEGRRSSANEVPHRITKINPRDDEGDLFDEIVPPGVKDNTTDTTPADMRQSGPPVVEVAVVTDKKHSEALGSDKRTLEYCIVLFNCVTLRFSTMKNMPVIFKLVAVKRNLATGDQPYIENNMVSGYAMAGETLGAFADYCRKNRLFSNADLVHLVMKQDMGSKDAGSNTVYPNVAGIGYVGGCCDNYKYAASEDDGFRYSGGSTVAHELCHNLGCPHDGDPPPSYLPTSPGAASCPWDDGYMMSYVVKYPNKYIFSKCSEECVQDMYRIAACLRTQNVQSAVGGNDKRLPGEEIKDSTGLHDRKAYYERRCKDMQSDLFVMEPPFPGDNCQYRCRTPANQDRTYYYWNLRCLDGEVCATGKMCKNGECV